MELRSGMLPANDKVGEKDVGEWKMKGQGCFTFQLPNQAQRWSELGPNSISLVNFLISISLFWQTWFNSPKMILTWKRKTNHCDGWPSKAAHEIWRLWRRRAFKGGEMKRKWRRAVAERRGALRGRQLEDRRTKETLCLITHEQRLLLS